LEIVKISICLSVYGPDTLLHEKHTTIRAGKSAGFSLGWRGGGYKKEPKHELAYMKLYLHGARI